MEYRPHREPLPWGCMTWRYKWMDGGWMVDDVVVTADDDVCCDGEGFLCRCIL